MKILDGRSYFWAAIGGPVYVLLMGLPGRALVMLGVTALLVAAGTGALVIIVGGINHLAANLFAVAAVPCAVLVAQGIVAVRLVRGASSLEGGANGTGRGERAGLHRFDGLRTA